MKHGFIEAKDRESVTRSSVGKLADLEITVAA